MGEELDPCRRRIRRAGHQAGTRPLSGPLSWAGIAGIKGAVISEYSDLGACPWGTGGKTGLVRVGQVGSGEITLQAEPEVCETGRLGGGTGGQRGWRGRWGQVPAWPGGREGIRTLFCGSFPHLRASLGRFLHSLGLCPWFSPTPASDEGGLVPTVLGCPPPPGALQAEAFPLPAACPGLSVSPPLGRGEACFSSLLRNRASETHNAAVKISGSVRAGAQRAPCSPHRQRPRGAERGARLRQPPAGGGVGASPWPSGLCALGLPQGTDDGVWITHSRKMPS